MVPTFSRTAIPGGCAIGFLLLWVVGILTSAGLPILAIVALCKYIGAH